MKKKLVALAVASLTSGLAAAQTNVTVYGVIDAGYVYGSGDAGTAAGGGTNRFSGIAPGINAGNRLGFTGEEALGNGLKAVFTLEYGLNVDDNSGLGNTGGLNARQQFVGLSSNYGTLSLGRQYAPGFNATANNDALEATDMSLLSDMSVYAGNSITPNSPARYNNSIAYTSPSMAGITIQGIYGFGESNTGGLNNSSVVDNGQYGLGLNYANGPINLDAVWQAREPVVQANPLYVPGLPATGNAKLPGYGKSINEWYVGGSYDFKVVKLYASYQALDNNNSNPVPGPISQIFDNQLWTLGITAPIGAGTLGLSYGNITIDRKNISDGESWGWGTMYTYPLSKRTAVYAAYTYINNDSNSIGIQTQVVGSGMGVAGESNYTFGTGIRHSF